MPKLQAYKPQPEEEKITRIKLFDHGNGNVTVIAVDKDGNRADTFYTLKDGKFVEVQ